MNVQLLLLLAFVGPFCAFTRASPTTVPTDLDTSITEGIDVDSEATEAPKEDITVVTGPPVTETATVFDEVRTETVTEAATPAPTTVDNEEPIVETNAPSSAAAPEPLITDAPAVETAAPTEAAKTDIQPVTAAAESEAAEDVVIDEGTEAGLSSGHLFGIVIAALLAVVIVITVVVVVVRRIGKYTSAKNKKPAKKDSIMALRKSAAKKQERPKFWKF